MSYNPDNLFAKVLRGDIPCKKVFENDYVLAFHDIKPRRKVHILVIPKGSYINFSDFSTNASPEEIAGFFQSVAEIAVEQGLAESGYRLITNQNVDGGQEVPHFHIHMLGGELVGPLVS